MRYDVDTRVEQTARQLAYEWDITVDELRELHGGAPNATSARVYARAVELRLAGLPR